MKKIAFYGKGGIGKSTTVSNLSAALAEKGYQVLQIGCDPKADSTRNLTGGRPIPTVLATMREKKNGLTLEDIVCPGFGGVLCVEAGGPMPGSGCAGRGIITAFEQLEELGAYGRFQPDVVLYDVLGDVVCGGFALPIRKGYAEKIYIVSSGEMMSLYAANNIATAVKNFSSRNYAMLGGVIYNAKGDIPEEDETMEKALREIGTRMVMRINRDPVVQQAERQGKTVIEFAPRSGQAEAYRQLARLVVEEN